MRVVRRLLRVVLTVLAAVPFGAGWVAGAVVAAGAWVAAAARVGWAEARRMGGG